MLLSRAHLQLRHRQLVPLETGPCRQLQQQQHQCQQQQNHRVLQAVADSAEMEASTSQAPLPVLTGEPAAPGFLAPDLQPVAPWKRPEQRTYTQPSVRDTGTLRPQPEWYPAWMKYRRREDNYVFWQDKFMRCSLDIPPIEQRWTVFSSLWYLVTATKYFAVPAVLRFVCMLAWRGVMQRAYEAHKALVLWQCKVDAYLASRATGGRETRFSAAMAMRRLHWRNTLLAEVLYTENVIKTGRVHLLPPVKKPLQRPTFFFLF